MFKFQRSAAICLLAGNLLILSGCQGDKLEASTEYWLQAETALENGDKGAAIELLTEAIDAGAGNLAIIKRGKLYAELGKDDLARQDCQTVLASEPDSTDANWLMKELDKSSEQRFQGDTSAPPSHNK